MKGKWTLKLAAFARHVGEDIGKQTNLCSTRNQHSFWKEQVKLDRENGDI